MLHTFQAIYRNGIPAFGTTLRLADLRMAVVFLFALTAIILPGLIL